MSDSLWLHGLHHARLPCPSPTPRACSNSCPLSRWCHPTISSHLILCRPLLLLSSIFPSIRVFSSSHVWMWELDYKVQHRRTDAFELWCWRRLLRVPWAARRSNQSILKEISPEYSLEGLMLKFQYFGHLMQRTDSLEKTLILGKTESRRRGW